MFKTYQENTQMGVGADRAQWLRFHTALESSRSGFTILVLPTATQDQSLELHRASRASVSSLLKKALMTPSQEILMISIGCLTSKCSISISYHHSSFLLSWCPDKSFLAVCGMLFLILFYHLFYEHNIQILSQRCKLVSCINI